MTLAGDAFNLYVLLEVASLTGYALVAMGKRKQSRLAAFKYIPRFLGMVWRTKPSYGMGILVVRLVSAFTPLAMLWVGVQKWRHVPPPYRGGLNLIRAPPMEGA